jgi:hypothetical protein
LARPPPNMVLQWWIAPLRGVPLDSLVHLRKATQDDVCPTESHFRVLKIV